LPHTNSPISAAARILANPATGCIFPHTQPLLVVVPVPFFSRLLRLTVKQTPPRPAAVTNNKQQTTNNKQQTTNNKQLTTDHCQLPNHHSHFSVIEFFCQKKRTSSRILANSATIWPSSAGY
jgi:hypothetical protein